MRLTHKRTLVGEAHQTVNGHIRTFASDDSVTSKSVECDPAGPGTSEKYAVTGQVHTLVSWDGI